MTKFRIIVDGQVHTVVARSEAAAMRIVLKRIGRG